MTAVSLWGMAVAPAVGMFVDRFRAKKTLFLAGLLLVGAATFSLTFTPRASYSRGAAAELKCDARTSETVLETVHAGNVQQSASEPDDGGSLTCEVNTSREEVGWGVGEVSGVPRVTGIYEQSVILYDFKIISVPFGVTIRATNYFLNSSSCTLVSASTTENLPLVIFFNLEDRRELHGAGSRE